MATYSFPWTMYVDVPRNYRTAAYTQVPWKPGTVSSGTGAWYSKFWIYPATNSAINYHYYGLICKGVRCVAEQYLYRITSNSCSDQIPGTPECTIYH